MAQLESRGLSFDPPQRNAFHIRRGSEGGQKLRSGQADMKIYFAVILTLVAWSYFSEYVEDHVIHFPICRDGRCGAK